VGDKDVLRLGDHFVHNCAATARFVIIKEIYNNEILALNEISL